MISGFILRGKCQGRTDGYRDDLGLTSDRLLDMVRNDGGPFENAACTVLPLPFVGGGSSSRFVAGPDADTGTPGFFAVCAIVRVGCLLGRDFWRPASLTDWAFLFAKGPEGKGMAGMGNDWKHG